MMAQTLAVVGPEMKDELKIFKVNSRKVAPIEVGGRQLHSRKLDKLPTWYAESIYFCFCSQREHDRHPPRMSSRTISGVTF